jgi:hypothetical protein
MAKKVPFPPDSPKQCPCAHKHISWVMGDNYVFCWDCNRRYPLAACFGSPEPELSEPEKSNGAPRPLENQNGTNTRL